MSGPGIPDEEWMVCAVCNRLLEKLDRMDNAGNVLSYTWEHPTDVVLAGEDHAPVPVMRKDAQQIEEHCDFCFASDPAFVLPVRDFEEPFKVNPQPISVSGWACCTVCAGLIRRGYWDRLVSRAFKAYKDRNRGKRVDPRVEGMIGELYRKIQQHVTGPVVPKGEA